MSVDHQRCIVGSANINDRSLDGQRDSEVALLCTAPDGSNELRDCCLDLLVDHAAGEGATRQQQREFWNQPGQAVLAELNKRAAANWAVYCNDEVVATLPHRHLVPYPIKVDVVAKLQKNPIVVDATHGLMWSGIPDCVAPHMDSTVVPNWLVE